MVLAHGNYIVMYDEILTTLWRLTLYKRKLEGERSERRASYLKNACEPMPYFNLFICGHNEKLSRRQREGREKREMAL